jgi:predicted ATPase/transcriptional regulator with XRE-family HTH domain
MYNLSMPGSNTAVSPDTFVYFGDLLRYLRERAELSQRELALQVGYHYSYMSRIEKNERMPDSATLMARFIPALGLEDEPKWTERLLRLAASEEKTMAPRKASQTAVAPLLKPDSAVPTFEFPLSPLPLSLTPLLGREKEVAAVTKILSRFNVRLVTLIGPPGVGKTRLAVQVANEAADMFAHGVQFIDFAPVSEPSGFLSALGRGLGVNDIPDVPLMTRLVQALRQKNVLLVLDNFEQLIEAAPQVHQLLSNAPEIKVLVTSREALHITGENEFTVSPLSLPQDLPKEQDLTQFPAIQLFIERARAVQPNFQLTPENTPAVLEICRRLDGLPLAIELAAARVKALSPQAMLSQFNRRFDWLAPNKRAEQSSRQTLRGAIEWSYNLLSEKEQILFRRLSVFSDERTLESVEAVCADVDIPLSESESALHANEILDVLIQLTDKSLLFSDTLEKEARFNFLETIHDFAREKLRQSGEEVKFKNRHLAYYCKLAEQAEVELERADQVVWGDRCEREHNNLRTALDWSLKEGADLQTGIRLAASLSLFWIVRNHFIEGLERIKVFLQKAYEPAEEPVLAKLLFRAGDLHLHRGELDAALKLCTQGVELCRKINEKRLLAPALYCLGDTLLALGDLAAASEALKESAQLSWEINYPEVHNISLILLGQVYHLQGDRVAAHATLKEGLALAQRISDHWAIAFGLQTLASFFRSEKNYKEAQANFERCLEASRIVGDKIIVGMVLANLAILANLQNQYAESGKYAEDALSIFQAVGDEIQQPFPLRMMGYAAIDAGNLVRARVLIRESLRGNRVLQDIPGQLACVVATARCCLVEKNVKRAVSLCALIETRMNTDKVKLLEPDVKALHEMLMEGKKKLGEASYQTAYAAGTALKIEDEIMKLMLE